MNTKRIIALLIAAIMVLSMFPVMAISTSAAGEGMWTTYQGAGSYPSEDDEPPEEGEELLYPPESGYEYTSEGFSIVQPDWNTTLSPFATVSTTEAQNVKDGIYIKFRVDAYDYGGDVGSDHWICITLNTGKVEDDGSVTGKVQPGSTKYGGGWLTLLRGVGDGNVTSIPHLTDPMTDDFGGTFVPQGAGVSTSAELDADGREIITFEVAWNGSEYEIKVNGVVMPSMADTTTLLERLSPTGDFFVGITMMDGFKGGEGADLTILEYGTSASDATKPVGNDSKEPGENEYVDYPIIDSSTVEAGQPAILWDPTTYKLTSGNNCSFTVLGDDTWRCTATETGVFFSLSPKRKWSYEAVDFPVFGIMVRNLWLDSGTFWYAAGEITGANDQYNMPFSLYDGEFYEDAEGNEYAFVPVDLTDLWEGRINAIRLDFAMDDEATREFDLCFAGMFRSEEEAYAYAENYLANKGVDTSVTEEVTEPETDPETAPETTPDGDATQAPDGEDTKAPENNETEAPKEGCGGIIGFGAVAILSAAAAAVALKKKD